MSVETGEQRRPPANIIDFSNVVISAQEQQKQIGADSELVGPKAYKNARGLSWPWFDAAVIFCGGYYKTGKLKSGGWTEQSRWAPTHLRHSDKHGVLGGGLRLASAVELYLEGVTNTFIFSGGGNEKTSLGVDVEKAEIPKEADIYKDQFLRVINRLRDLAMQRKARGLGYDTRFDTLVEPDVLTETKSNNTASSAKEIVDLLHREKDKDGRDLRKVLFVSSGYHLPRVATLLDREFIRKYPKGIFATAASVLPAGVDLIAGDTREDGTLDLFDITFNSADNITRVLQNRKYAAVLHRYLNPHTSDPARIRYARERQGFDDLLSGRYKMEEQGIEQLSLTEIKNIFLKATRRISENLPTKHLYVLSLETLKEETDPFGSAFELIRIGKIIAPYIAETVSEPNDFIKAWVSLGEHLDASNIESVRNLLEQTKIKFALHYIEAQSYAKREHASRQKTHSQSVLDNLAHMQVLLAEDINTPNNILAQRLSVSRARITGYLKILDNEGLLEGRRNRVWRKKQTAGDVGQDSAKAAENGSTFRQTRHLYLEYPNASLQDFEDAIRYYVPQSEIEHLVRRRQIAYLHYKESYDAIRAALQPYGDNISDRQIDSALKWLKDQNLIVRRNRGKMRIKEGKHQHVLARWDQIRELLSETPDITEGEIAQRISVRAGLIRSDIAQMEDRGLIPQREKAPAKHKFEKNMEKRRKIYVMWHMGQTRSEMRDALGGTLTKIFTSMKTKGELGQDQPDKMTVLWTIRMRRRGINDAAIGKELSERFSLSDQTIHTMLTLLAGGERPILSQKDHNTEIIRKMWLLGNTHSEMNKAIGISAQNYIYRLYSAEIIDSVKPDKKTVAVIAGLHRQRASIETIMERIASDSGISERTLRDMLEVLDEKEGTAVTVFDASAYST